MRLSAILVVKAIDDATHFGNVTKKSGSIDYAEQKNGV
jgi:hypothetical protein